MWRRIALGCLALVALLALAYGLRSAWLTPLALRYARAALGAEIQVERVSGSWLRDLTVEGLRWSSAEPPLLAIEEARLELEYSLLGALRGEPELVVRVRARGIELAAQGSTSGSVRLPDLALVELDLEQIRVRRPGGEPTHVDSVRAAGWLRAGEAHVDRLELVAGANRVALADSAVDLGGTTWLELARGLRGQLSATLPEAHILERLLGLPLPLRAAEFELSAAKGCAQLAGKLELEGGRFDLARGELVLPASGSWSELMLDLELSGSFDDLAPLGALLGQPLAGRWQGSIEVQGPLQRPVGRFSGHGEALKVAGLAFDAFEAEVRIDGRTASCEPCEISGPDLEVVLRGGLQLEPLEFVGMTMNVSADETFLSRILPFPCQSAFLHAHVDGPPQAPRGTFEVSADGAALGGLRVDDAQARGRVEGDSLEVAALRLKSGESSIRAAGTIRRAGTSWTGALAQLGLDWRGAHAELERGAEFHFAPGRYEVEGLELRSESAGRSGSARIALQHAGGETRADLRFDDYDAGPILAPFLPAGRAGGRVRGHVEGALGAEAGLAASTLAIDLALDGWSLDPAWPALSAVLRGEFDGRALDLQGFELGYAAGQDAPDESVRIAGHLRVPCDPARWLSFADGTVELGLEITTSDAVRSLRRAGIEPGLSRTGPCKLELELAGAWHELAGRLALEAAAVTLGHEASARACDLEAVVLLGERVRIERALFSAPSGTIALSGTLAAPRDVPRWITDRWALLEAPLELEARFDLADIGWIAGLSRALRRTTGQVAGKVQIRGNLLQPVLGGRLALEEGELRLSSSTTSVRNLAASIAFEQDVVRFERLQGEIGGAPVRASGTIEPFGPFPRLDLHLSGDNLLLARSSHLHLRSDADLDVKGTLGQLAIRGELRLTEGRYTGEISPLEELVRAGRRTQPTRTKPLSLVPDGPLADAELEVHLGGRRVFEYETNLLAAALRPDAWLRGTLGFPVLEGPVYVEAASLTLPSSKLELTSGVLNFRREAPLRPEAALKAEMHLQRHDIQAIATGTLDELEIVLSSNPPLPSDDLWILALTGQLPAARGEESNARAMEALAVFLARDALVRWLGSDTDDSENLLERFEIDVGAETSESGQPTGRVLFYLKPKSRRSGRATYLSAEIDEHDRVNYALGIVFRPR